MTGRASPFTALTGAEKQIKWLEVQSVKLPYVHGSVDAIPESAEEIPSVIPTQALGNSVSKAAAKPAQQAANTPVAPQQNPPAHAGFSSADFQKIRHRQYDAVIAKMKQAELSASQYHPLDQ